MSTQSHETSSESPNHPSEIQAGQDARTAELADATHAVEAAFREPTVAEWNRMSEEQQVEAWDRMSPQQRADNLLNRKFLMEALYAYKDAGKLDDPGVRYKLTEAAWTELKLTDPSDRGYMGAVATLLRTLEETGQESSKDYRKATTILLSDVEQGRIRQNHDRSHAINLLRTAVDNIADADIKARLDSLSIQ